MDLENYGLTKELVMLMFFLNQFRLHARDIYIQDFHSNLQNSNKALFYRHLINQLQPSLYLTCIRNVKYRQVLIYFRIRNHQLMVETVNWVKPRSLLYDERLCNLCQRQDLEDEYHLVLICPVYI